MTGTTLNWEKHCKAEFGAYWDVYEEHKPTNTIDNAHTCSDISLGPTAKLQGSHTLLCLKTGNLITRKEFRVVPMPESVVERVEELSTIDAQLDKDLNFEDHNNIPIEDVDDTTEGATTSGVEIEIPGVEI